MLVALGLTGVLAASLTGCLHYDGDYPRGYIQDERQISQVKPGQTKQQVLALLGDPSTTSTVGGDAWYYVSQDIHQPFAFSAPTITDQRVLAVYFTPKTGKLERIANYGLQDGVVFDFISRTTPTSGGDQSFIKNMLGSFLKWS
ncbi:outer membrane protein assembly factor BamE [Methylovirgula sp. 4M-Z18]|nr:outer membrane protein assembly factor BamE [Methylovirgula sp. 4M-Z18]